MKSRKSEALKLTMGSGKADSGEVTEGNFRGASPPHNDVTGKTTAAQLLGNQRLLRIEHNGCEDVLRLTKNDKLILTK